MKNFLLGVASTLVALLLLATIGVFVLGAGAPRATSTPTPTPTSSAATVVAPPADLRDDETWLQDFELHSADVVSPQGDLDDLVAKGSGMRSSPGGLLRAQRLEIEARVPFRTVAEKVGEGTRLYAVDAGRVGIERTVTIFGQDLTVRAISTVVADQGQLLIEPESVDLGGPAFLDSAASAIARNLVTIRQDLPGMPDGVVLTEVTVSGAGFRVFLAGKDVTIKTSGTQ